MITFKLDRVVFIPSDKVHNVGDLCDVVIQPELVTSLNCVQSGHLE